MPKPPRGTDHARPVQKRYDAIVADMVARHGLRVRRWRKRWVCSSPAFARRCLMRKEGRGSPRDNA